MPKVGVSTCKGHDLEAERHGPLAARYAINPKSVAKWKKRKTVQDAPMGPKNPASTVLTKAGEAVIVAFRKYTLLDNVQKVSHIQQLK